MPLKPIIFISAVSKELRSARKLVFDVLFKQNFDPRTQDIAKKEAGELLDVLRRWIKDSVGVVQIIGKAYGAEPTIPTKEFGRVSYTQFEALYAQKLRKPVWYVFAKKGFKVNRFKPESATLRKLQAEYVKKLVEKNVLRHEFATDDALRVCIHDIESKLEKLRAKYEKHVKRVEKDLTILKTGQARVEKELATIDAGQAALLEAMRNLPQALAQLSQQGQKEDEATRMARAYASLEEKLKLPAGTLEKELPAFAEQFLLRADTSAIDRANALFATKKFAEAEAQALKAKDKALAAAGKPVQDAIKALMLAGSAALEQIQYARALEHYRAAAALTSQERDALEWARVQYAIAFVLDDLGRAQEAEPILKDVLKIRERVLGPEHPDTLSSRNNLATALQAQGKNAEAEQEHRAVLKIRERVLGPEHPDTLGSRNNLAAALREQGKNAEAEQEHRAVLKIRERVLGPEHPDTLSSRNNLAAALQVQGKNAEAEQEHRAVLKIMERVLGAEHPDTLASRNNLANALDDQGKNAEAEQEHRAVLKIRERVLGPEHPNVFQSCYNLALCLKAQGKLKEALEMMLRAETGSNNVLGTEHPDSKDAKRAREWIEAALK